MKPRVYRGCNVWRQNGWWISYTGKTFVRADTLVGVKQLITEELYAH